MAQIDELTCSIIRDLGYNLLMSYDFNVGESIIDTSTLDDLIFQSHIVQRWKKFVLRRKIYRFLTQYIDNVVSPDLWWMIACQLSDDLMIENNDSELSFHHFDYRKF